jgi:iron-sulfur cluster repair protein YtfE (RIC family)
MDALELLIGDHNRVRGLFTRFKAAKEADDLATMATLATTILDELKVHTAIEEEIFYPELQDATEEIHESITEGFEEHHVAKGVMAEIAAEEPNTEDWAAKVTVLIENIEHHAGEEETELFPKVRTATSAEQRASLADRMEARKAELGAPTMADKEGLTKQELIDLAKEQEIPGRSKMSTEQLTAAVAPR